MTTLRQPEDVMIEHNAYYDPPVTVAEALKLHARYLAAYDAHDWSKSRAKRLDGVEFGIGTEDSLARVNLRGANLRYASLSYAHLSGADLSHADLTNANLHGADLGGANLSNANLSEADLSGAELDGANFDGADITGAYLTVYGDDSPFVAAVKPRPQ